MSSVALAAARRLSYDERVRPGGRPRLLLSTAFFASGATGLAYEIIWQKTFATLFGNSTYAASAVIAVFMCGLALGSILTARFVDRRLRLMRIYGIVEMSIGVAGWCVPRAIRLAEPVVALAYHRPGTTPVDLALLRIGLAVAVLAVPTTFMGSTLPIVSKLFVRSDAEIGSGVGWLYALNTLGAVVGASVAGFVLIHAVGLERTLTLTSGVNVAVGAIVLLADFRAPLLDGAARSSPPIGTEKASARPPSIMWPTLFVSGFTAVAYQVLWMRIFQFVYARGSSVHAFALIVTTFLVGNFLGSTASARLLARHQASMRALSAAHALLACSVVGGIALLAAFRAGAGDRAVGDAMIAALVIPPTFLMGVGFPLMMRLATVEFGALGASIGAAYAVNTLGCVAGPLVTGFVAIGAIGTSGTLAALATADIALAVALLASDSCLPSGRVAAFACLGAVAAAASWVFSGRLLVSLFVHHGDPLLFFREDPVTTVVATGKSPYVWLDVGGMTGVGTLPRYLANDELLADVPLLLRPGPRKIAVVGFGTGRTTALYAAQPGVAEVDVVEVSESVLVAGRTLFAGANHDVLSRANVHAITDDGFNYLKYVPKHFDVISVDAWGPWIAGSAALYTREFWKLCSAKLEPGGLFVTWTFARGTDDRTLKILLRTFDSVFAHTRVLLTPDAHYILLVGSQEPVVLDPERIRAAFDGLSHVKNAFGPFISNTQEFLSYFVADDHQIRAYARDESSMNTLDRPVLELSSSRPGRVHGNLGALEFSEGPRRAQSPASRKTGTHWAGVPK